MSVLFVLHTRYLDFGAFLQHPYSATYRRGIFTVITVAFWVDFGLFVKTTVSIWTRPVKIKEQTMV